MSALPSPTPSPSNRRRDPVTAFREDYATICAEAEIAARHTDTEGWQALYGSVRRDCAIERMNIAKELGSLAELFGDGYADSGF